ncbi:hypothetical protein PMAYCL1PPCAC_20724, partial [Pristionchus mayeri]
MRNRWMKRESSTLNYWLKRMKRNPMLPPSFPLLNGGQLSPSDGHHVKTSLSDADAFNPVAESCVEVSQDESSARPLSPLPVVGQSHTRILSNAEPSVAQDDTSALPHSPLPTGDQLTPTGGRAIKRLQWGRRETTVDPSGALPNSLLPTEEQLTAWKSRLWALPEFQMSKSSEKILIAPPFVHPTLVMMKSRLMRTVLEVCEGEKTIERAMKGIRTEMNTFDSKTIAKCCCA